MGTRSEPSTPADASKGVVWTDIVRWYEQPGFASEFISVADLPREILSKHPWSLGGGGAFELKRRLEDSRPTLSTIVTEMGFGAIIGEDDLFVYPEAWLRRRGIPSRRLANGQDIRDWSLTPGGGILNVFDEDLQPALLPAVERLLWPYKATLLARIVSGTTTFRASGKQWFEFVRLAREKLKTPVSVAYAEVATHNHFVLDRGGGLFKQTAPLIKLSVGAGEQDYLALLAVLNSSTACFWMKQVAMNKGGSGIGRGVQDEAWEGRYQFDATKLAQLPLPDLGGLAQYSEEMLMLVERARTLRLSRPDDWKLELEGTMFEQVALQERLDCEVYRRFGLGVGARGIPDLIRPGSRPFEYTLNEDRPGTAWFERNGYARPEGPSPYDTSGYTPEIRLIEQPEYKRRWGIVDEVECERGEIQETLLSGVEDGLRRGDTVVQPIRVSAEQGELLRRVDEGTSATAMEGLVDQNAIPYLAALRYTEPGLEKRAKWEETWALQRREDAGEKLAIAVPPKYDVKDFRDPNYFRLRGKLDVPKERFISYPGAEKDDDKSPLYGWAGWDQLQQATALAALYHERKTEDGWPADRLVPLLAGLLELVPWLKQWHNDRSDDFGGEGAGDWYERYVEGEARGLGRGIDELRAWRPGKARKGIVRDARPPRMPAAPLHLDSLPANQAADELTSDVAAPAPLPWDSRVLVAASRSAGVGSTSDSWAYGLEGETAGVAALCAVLRQASSPMLRADVERAVVLTLLPRLHEKDLGGPARELKNLLGAGDWKRTSIASLAIPWTDIVSRGPRDGLLEKAPDGRWRAGDMATRFTDPVLEARAAVALSWLGSAPAVTRAVEEQVGALNAA